MEKKVSVKAVKTMLKNFDMKPVKREITLGDEKVEISIKPVVSPNTIFGMVNTVANTAFQDGVYDASIVDLAKAGAIMCNVANFSADLTDEQYNHILYFSDAMQVIFDVWSDKQRAAFDIAVDETIQHKRQEMVAEQKARLDSIADQLTVVASYMESLSGGFKNIDPDTMNAAFKNLSKIDENDICAKVIDIRGAGGEQDESGTDN